MSKAVVIPECNKDIGGMKDEISLSPNEKKDGAMRLISRLLRLDTLGKRSSGQESPTSTEPPTTYYGVYIPCEIKKGPDEGKESFCVQKFVSLLCIVLVKCLHVLVICFISET